MSGIRFTTYHQSSTAASDVPDDLTATVVAALVPTATGYQTIPGTGDAAGHFRVENVPPGEFLLQLGDTYYATDASDLDGGVDVFGRAPAGDVAAGTVIAIELSGLAPASEADWIQLVSPEANQASVSATTAAFTAGATTFSAERPFAQLFGRPGTIEAALGDHLIVGQMAPSSGTMALARAAVLDGFTVTSGAATLSAMLAELPLHPVQLSMPPTAFGMALGMPPAEEPGRVRAGTSQFDVSVHQTRSPLEYGRTGTPVGSAFASWTPSVNDPANLRLEYGALGAGWSPYAVVELRWSMRYRYAFGLLETSLPQTVMVVDSEQALASAPVTPAVSAPRQARIGDAAFTASLSGGGPTPTLSWTVPETGAATWYELQVWELTTDGVRTSRTRGPVLVTTATSLRVPPDLLVPGRLYVFELRAVSAPGVDRRTALRRQSFPYAEATVLSGIYEP